MLKHTLRRPEFSQLHSAARLYRKAVHDANDAVLHGHDLTKACTSELLARLRLSAVVKSLAARFAAEEPRSFDDMLADLRALAPAREAVARQGPAYDEPAHREEAH